jgi:subtilisin family serine protease
VHAKGFSGLGVTIAFIDAGFYKSHDAFAQHYADGRVLAEYDFVHNDGNVDLEAGDYGSQNSHGTRVWSVAGGWSDGILYGPAYQANFILCMTEDIASETNVEEDNWVAAMEFSDSIGTDVISSSVGYLEYDDSCNCDLTYADLDGQTAISSIAASMADGLGIVVSKSAGNSGSAPGTITAPADAFDILSVGAVSSFGSLAAFSSRGPTFDGRIKPEVCARGVSTYTAAAHSSATNIYGAGSGTSFSQPLVAGAAALVIEAHPEWTPYQVREALKMSGDRASNPDNNYGWGIIDVDAAIGMNPPCCRGQVGDVNGLGGDVPTIGDISLMIDHLIINNPPLNCLSEADINQSGGGNPIATDITLGDITILIDHLYISQAALLDCL